MVSISISHTEQIGFDGDVQKPDEMLQEPTQVANMTLGFLDN